MAPPSVAMPTAASAGVGAPVSNIIIMPHHEALACLAVVNRLLRARRSTNLKAINQDFTRLLALVLSRHHFELNNTFWTQTGGVAMGGRVSPIVANLSIHDFETKQLLFTATNMA